MSYNNEPLVSVESLGQGVVRTKRSEVRLLARALGAKGWVPDDDGMEAVQILMEVARCSPDERTRVLAAKGVIAAGMRDAAVERTRVQEAGQENAAALAALRAYLATDEGRKAMSSGDLPPLPDAITDTEQTSHPEPNSTDTPVNQ